MKAKEKKEAIKKRKQGYSLKAIAQDLNVSKSSVSLWVRDVHLTNSQFKNLKESQHTTKVIEKRRRTRLQNGKAKKAKIINKASQQITRVSRKDLFLIGVSLYLGEGSKKKPGVVEFVNSDPDLIKIMMKFFTEICEVPNEKFRGHIHLHSHLAAFEAEKYWSSVSGIPQSQFFKTSQQRNKSSKGKKDSLPYGTMSIYICTTELQLTMVGWMKGVIDKIEL